MAPTPGESEPLLASRSVSSESNWELTPAARRRAVWTLPLVVITYFMSYYTPGAVLAPYLYDQVAEELHFKKNSSSQHPCSSDQGNGTNSTHHLVEEAIQRRVSTIELYMSLSGYPCAALSILIVGPLTDRYGRRIGFLFPIVGTLLKQAIYAATVGLGLPLLTLIAGTVCEAVGGSFAAMLTAMFTVVSDVTHPGPRRSLFITVMEALQTLTGATVGYAMGHWIKASYSGPLVFSLIGSVVSLVLALALLPETLQRHGDVAPSPVAYTGLRAWLATRGRGVLASSFRKFKTSFSLYIRDPSAGHHGLAKRRLCLLVFILTVAVNFSSPAIQTLYLLKWPRCWPITRTLTFGSIQIVSNWAAILLLLTLLQKVFKVADRHVAILGVVSSLTSAVFMSLATNDVMVYEVAVLAVMVRAIIPMLRSVMSSLVGPSNQGSMYTSMGCVELIGAATFSTVANRLYYATLSSWDGAVFLMFAGLMAVALVLLIFLNLLYRQDQSRADQAAPVEVSSAGNIQRAPVSA